MGVRKDLKALNERLDNLLKCQERLKTCVDEGHKWKVTSLGHWTDQFWGGPKLIKPEFRLAMQCTTCLATKTVKYAKGTEQYTKLWAVRKMIPLDADSVLK